MLWEHFVFGKLCQEKQAPTLAFISELLEQAQKCAPLLRSLKLADIIRVLDRTGKLWSDPSYLPRQQALAHMPEVVGFSPKMVELGLNELSKLCSAENLRQIVNSELRDAGFLDGWQYSVDCHSYLRAMPLGTVVHVSPGNVFLGAADSLVRGLLTKNINILKVSNSDPIFPLLFAQSIKDAAALEAPEVPLAELFAVVSFRGGDLELEQCFKQHCQGVVVWGGQSAVNAWQQNVPLGLRVVPYGPRLSLALITERFWQADLPDSAQCAQLLAKDVVMWEQRGCGSPQLLFLQVQPGANPAPFISALRAALAQYRNTIPPAILTRDEQVELLRERELADFSSLTGEGQAWYEGNLSRSTWTIIWRRQPTRLGSPLNRTLIIYPYQELSQVLAALAPQQGILQSVGIGALPEERTELLEQLATCGAQRFTPLGAMHTSTPGAPHDSSFQLDRLVRWTCLENVPDDYLP